MLHILLGRAKSGRTGIMAKRVGRDIVNGRRAAFIVPDQETFITESRLLTENNFNGLMGTEVLSFNRLCQRIIKWSGRNPGVRLDDTGRSMLLAGAVMQCGQELAIFHSSAAQPGFIDRLSRMIAVFKSCGLTPQGLRELAARSEGLLKAKLTDAALIFEKYEELLKGGYADNQDYFTLACLLAPNCGTLKGTSVYIDGFEVFTQKMLELIISLCKAAPEVYISLPCAMERPDKELYGLSENTFKRLTACAFKEGIKYEVKYLKAGREPDELVFLSENLFAYPHCEYAGKVRNISLFEGKNPEEEVRRAAGLIREAALSGERYRDFAVITSSPAVYTPIIDRIFRQYDIPVFTDIKRPVPAQPLVRLILALLDIKEQGMKNILEYASSPLMGFMRKDRQSLARLVREAGLKQQEFMSGRAGRLEEGTKAELERLRDVFLPPIRAFEEKIRSCRRVEQYAKAITLFLEEYKIAQKLEEDIKKLEEMDLPSQADEMRQVWELTVNLLEQLELLLGDRAVGRRQFSGMLSQGFARSEVGVIPSSVDCVLLGDISRTKTSGVKTAFILGANEGMLPAAVLDDGLFSGRELDGLNQMGAQLEPDRSMQVSQQNYDIYSAFLSPSEKLYVSYSLASNEGAGLRPSHIISRLRLIFPSLELESGLSSKVWLATPASGLPLLFASVRSGLSEDLEDYLLYLKQNGEKNAAFLKRALSPAKKAKIDADRARDLFFSRGSVSVSRLETQGLCPYMHFVNYGLKALRSEDYKLNVRDAGSLLHDIMENCLALFNGRDLSALTREEIFEAVDRILKERAPQYRYGYLVSSKRALRQTDSLAVMARIAVYEAVRQLAAGSFIQVGREIVFDTNRDYPPIRLATPAGELKLRGVVDRADMMYLQDERYVRIVDYKSGSDKFLPERVRDGTMLQLPLYMDAVLSAFKGAKAAGAFYFHIKELEGEEKILLSGPAVNIPEVIEGMDANALQGGSGVLNVKMSKNGLAGKNLLSPAAFDKLMDLAKITAGELALNIAQGRIECSPIDYGEQETPCRYCEHYLLCGLKEKGVFLRRACGKLDLETDNQDSLENGQEGGEN